MKQIRNENGVTLVEVLAAMAILGLILTSIINIFPQMGLMNTINEDKAQAINTAKMLLVDWQKSDKVKELLTNQSTIDSLIGSNYDDGKINFSNLNKDATDTFLTFETTKNSYNGKVKITLEHEIDSYNTRLHLVHIELLNNNLNQVSEIHGYIRIGDGF